MPLLSYHCEAEKCNIIIEKLARQGKKQTPKSLCLWMIQEASHWTETLGL